jgi:type I restriction enzyme S subunit
MGINLWQKKTLKELCYRIGDGIHGTPEYSSDSNIPFINGNNLKNGKIHITENTRFVTDEEFEDQKIELNSNSLLLSINGTLGSLAFYNDEQIMLGKSAAYLNFKTDINKFHYYYFQLKDVQNYFYNVATGSTIKNLSLKSIQDFEVPVPDEITYQQIAKVLSDLDAKIEVNNKINQQLESMAKTLYDYWFVQFDFPISTALDTGSNVSSSESRERLTNTKESSSPLERTEERLGYKSSGGKMVYNEELKREIPDGWEVGSLSSWIKNDKSGDWGKESEQGNYVSKVSCIRGADLNGLNGKGEVKAPTRFVLEKNSHKLLEVGDFIIEISGGSPVQSTGRMAFITEETLERFDNPLICSNFCKAVTLENNKAIYNFAYEWNRLYDAGVLFGWEGKTSGIKNLLFESFITNHLMTIPPMELIKQFYDYAKPIHSKIQKNLQQNQKLVELRDWLLPMLMNGQATVENLNSNDAGVVDGGLGRVAEGVVKYGKK